MYTPDIGRYILLAKHEGLSNATILAGLQDRFGVKIHRRTIRKWRARAEEEGLIRDLHMQHADATPLSAFYKRLHHIISQQRFTNILVINDLHFPFHDPQVADLILQVAGYENFHIIERGSDEHDCPNLSRYRQPAKMVATDYIQATVSLSQRFSKDIASQCENEPLMPFKIGNHDLRFVNFIEDQAVRVREYVMAKFIEDLHRASLWFMGWEWDGYEINQSYASIHGYLASKYTAEKFLHRYDHDLIVAGHSHRAQHHASAPMSNLQHDLVRQRASYTTGCACQLIPHYNKYSSRTQHWQHGFGIAQYDRGRDKTTFTNVLVQDDGERKSCMIGTKLFTSSKTGWSG